MAITKPTKPNTFINGPGNTADANAVNENFDLLYSKSGEIIDGINAAAGSRANLASRLGVSLEEDGTLKSDVTAGGEWVNPALSPLYVDASNYSVIGDYEGIYLVGRRLKIGLAGSTVYSEISAATYSAGSGLTVVTLADAVLTDPLSSVEHSIVRPIADDGAVTAHMVGAYTQDEIDASFGGLNTTVSDHVNATAPHSATSAATANRLILRDASGRAKIGAPAASDDIAALATVTGAVGTHEAIAATTSGGGHIPLATAAEMATATNATKAVTPATVKSSPFAAKAWVVYNSVTDTILSSAGVSSVTYDGTGLFTVTWATAFTAPYAVIATTLDGVVGVLNAAPPPGSAQILTETYNNSKANTAYVSVVAFGA